MELKFIWISKYKIIENLGVNFHHSDEHKFKYDSQTLMLIQNAKSPISFGANITGVTAIAGENGSGKSSLCEIVLLSTATHTEGAFGFDYLFKGIVCYGDHIFVHESIHLKNTEDLVRAKYTVEVFRESPFEKMKQDWKDTFVKGGFVYYSNMLDPRTDMDAVNLANISTVSSINRSSSFSTSYQRTSAFPQPGESNRDKDRHSTMFIHDLVESNRIVKFYISFPELVSFINPNEIVIKSTYSGNNRWLDLDKTIDKSNGGDYWTKQSIREQEKQILDFILDRSDIEDKSSATVDNKKFKRAIKLLYKYNLIIAESIMKNELPNADSIYQLVFSAEPKKHGKIKTNHDLIIELHDSIVERAISFEPHIFEPLSLPNYYNEVKDWRFYLIEKLYLTNNQENRQLLLQFTLLEEKILGNNGPFRRITNYNLPPLSSGENSFLTFFARIFDVIGRYDKGHYAKNKIILFIDEAEVGFHPAWKRIYFQKLLEFLNICTTEYSFQIIMTTHSPYLLSDLPGNNVILLKKDEKGNTKFLDSNNFKTFGSNIHELLGTSFFLNDGFMGEFAKEKIEELIAFFEGKNQIHSRESAKHLIALIGDELVADRLLDMYNVRFENDVPTNDLEYETWLTAELQRVKLKKE